MRGVWTKIIADLRRRRVQTAVIALIIALASGTWTAALTLLATSGKPYQQAFDQQRGSHLRAIFDTRYITADQLRGTSQAIGAAAVGGPWPIAQGIRFEQAGSKYALNVVGRDAPGGDVQVLRLTQGRWVQAADEIVVTRSFAQFARVGIGDQIIALSRPDKPGFRIVGEAIDVDEADAASFDQSAWVLPSQVATLAPTNTAVQMAYRFGHTPNDSELAQLTDRLRAAVSPAALTELDSYVNTQRILNTTNGIVLVFLLAFSIFALLAAAAIIANLVIGIILSSYREIGIMKAIGFSPGQVVEVYVGQMIVTAFFGCLIGIPLGLIVSQPLLNRVADALGLSAPAAIVPLVEISVLAGILLVVAISAVLPAIRAGRLSAVRAITMGMAPSGRKGGWFGRLVAKLGLPRSISLGAGNAFVRPLRSGITSLSIVVGVATLLLAVGVAASFDEFVRDSPLSYVQVKIDRFGAYPDASVMRTLNAQSQTDTVVAFYNSRVVVPGVSDFVNGLALRGDVTRIGFSLTSGRWYQQTGEAVASPGLLAAAHLKLGDSVPVTMEGHPYTLRVVGILNERGNVANEFNLDWSTFVKAVPEAVPSNYLIRLKPGADAVAYTRTVQQTEPDFLSVALFELPGATSAITVFDVTIFALAILLALIAIAGVFNAVLLTIRDSAKDTAVLKALGMTPRQVMVMVSACAGVLGLIGGLIGMPAGVLFHHGALQFLSSAIGNPFPPAAFNVFNPGVVLLIGVVGLAIAIVGGLLPAGWAARSSVVEVLHTE
jgi:putative ABC transport system permease protein